MFPEQLSVPLTREQAEFVRRQAERERRSLSWIVRELVEAARHGELLGEGAAR